MSNYLKTKAMKRLSIFGLMLASAFALTNCTEQVQLPDVDNDLIVDEITNQENPEEGISIPFEVYATADAETKTVNSENDTKWAENDRISVYHAPAGTTTFHKHAEFTIRNVEEGLFGGALKSELSSNNDWYFLYPYSSSADTPSAAQVTIGASKDAEGLYVQTLSADSKSHIAGPNYPMYGDQSEVSKSSNPRVQMKHLSALVALKVVNQGDGIKDNGDESIIVKDLTFSVPQITSKQTQLPIIGAFTVNTTGSKVTASNFTPVSGSSSNIVTLKLTESVTIPSGGEATFYIAVRPFNESSITRTVTDPILEVTINGSKRQVSIPSDKANFEAGTITTLRVPVKLSHPKTSNALSSTEVVGYEFISWSNKNDITLKVNGEKVNAYEVGAEGKLGTITLEGYAADMIKAMDVGFYASTWNGKRAAMTISNMNVWLPYGNGISKFNEHQGLKDVLISELEDDFGSTIAWAAVEGLIGGMSSGIPRDKSSSFDFITLTQFIDPQTITFNGVLENGAGSAVDDIFILDEEPIHKGITAETVNNLLKEKFYFIDASGNKLIPTYEGLKDIINGNENSDAANTTANAIYNKLKKVFADRGVYKISKKVVFVTVTADISFTNVFNALIPGVDELKDMVKRMKVQVTISTCPYHPNKADYGSKASPITLNNISGDKNPMIFWGLDMNGSI